MYYRALFISALLLMQFSILAGCQQADPTPPRSVATAPSPVQPSPPPVIAQSQRQPKSQPAALPRYSVPPLRELNHHRGVTTAPAFSPDGKLIATCCQFDGDIAVWNWPAGSSKEIINVIDGAGLVAVCFSEDSQKLAYACLGRTFGVFEISSGKRLHRVEDRHYHYYHGLHWSADNRYLYAVANYALENEIHRLSLETGESQVVVPKFEKRDASFCDYDPAPLFIQDWDENPERVGLFKLGPTIDIDNPLVSFCAPQSTESVPCSFAISHDGTHFAFRKGLSLRFDVYDVKKTKLAGSIEVNEDQLGGFQFIPGSNTKLIVYSGNNTWRYSSIAVRDITQPKQIRRLEVHAPTTVTGMSLSRDGKLLGLGFYDGQAGVWEVAAIEKADSR